MREFYYLDRFGVRIDLEGVGRIKLIELHLFVSNLLLLRFLSMSPGIQMILFLVSVLGLTDEIQCFTWRIRYVLIFSLDIL